MKHNDVVTLRNPQKDEMRFDGRPLPFRVLEMRSPRVAELEKKVERLLAMFPSAAERKE